MQTASSHLNITIMTKDFINILPLLKFKIPFLSTWQHLQALVNAQFLTSTRRKNDFETSSLTLSLSAQDRATVLV